MKPTLRIVHLFCRLLQRERLNRENVIEEYKINSRTFDRDISDIIRSLLPYEDRKALYYAIEDELKNYIELMHGKAILELQWRINKSIINKQKIQII